MATFKVGTGIDKYIDQLDQLSTSSDEMIKRAVFEGAAIVTDAVRANIQTLPTRRGGHYTRNKASGITETQKAGLLNGLGIAPFKNANGFIHVKVGMDGYNGNVSKKYPNGQANAMIARSVEAGTSFLQKHPFIAPAVRSTRAQAERAMAEAFDKECEKLFK